MSILRLNDREVRVSEVDVELVSEIRREKNRYTCLLGKAWEPCKPKLFSPFYLLAAILSY